MKINLFSFFWLFCLFALQCISIGVNLVRLGEPKTIVYNTFSLLQAIFFALLTAISLYLVL